MDLSYRAQLKGWHLLYLPDLVVPGEIPPVITAYKQQQARWAQGGTQCFRHWLIPVLAASRLDADAALDGDDAPRAVRRPPDHHPRDSADAAAADRAQLAAA